MNIVQKTRPLTSVNNVIVNMWCRNCCRDNCWWGKWFW